MSVSHQRLLKAAMIFIMAYSAIYLNWYWQTPLGLTPVLDGAENILLAEKIFEATLPSEPFYRAMLYPAFLSIFRFIGFSTDDLLKVAGCWGMICHLLNALLVGWISRMIWKNDKAFLAAMLLYGLYPLAIYFAADPLDITMAIFFMTLSLALIIKGIENKKAVCFLSSGITFGIGVLFRANILPMAGAFFLLIFNRDLRKNAVLSMFGLAIPLCLGGLISYSFCGEFRILPWQGSFNLYAANCETANGKYFQQTIMLPDREVGVNPARMESEMLYCKTTGESKPIDIEKFNSYWKHKSFSAIASNPVGWLSLVFRKVYYLFNDFEQYNNKTFSFHKSLSPALRYNPLSFGIILLLVVLALSQAKFDIQLKFLIQVFIFLAGGIIAFYVSARFRILLMPIMIAISAGIFTFEKKSLFKRKSLLLAAVTAFISFSPFLNTNDTSTYNSDRLLIAHACARLGLDGEQVKWANKALKEQPENLLAIRVKLVGFTNLALSGAFSDQKNWEAVAREFNFLAEKKVSYPDTMFLAGCYAFSFKNNKDEAWNYWKAGLAQSEQKDLFLAALILTGERKPEPSMLESAYSSPLLWYSLAKTSTLKLEKAPDQANLAAIKFLFGKDS